MYRGGQLLSVLCRVVCVLCRVMCVASCYVVSVCCVGVVCWVWNVGSVVCGQHTHVLCLCASHVCVHAPLSVVTSNPDLEVLRSEARAVVAEISLAPPSIDGAVHLRPRRRLSRQSGGGVCVCMYALCVCVCAWLVCECKWVSMWSASGLCVCAVCVCVSASGLCVCVCSSAYKCAAYEVRRAIRPRIAARKHHRVIFDRRRSQIGNSDVQIG